MRRRFLHLVIFLLIGAGISSALAIGFMWFKQGRTLHSARVFEGTTYIVSESPGRTAISWPGLNPFMDGREYPGKPPAWSSLRQMSGPHPPFQEVKGTPIGIMRRDVAFGWPRRALSFGIDHETTGPGEWAMTIRHGIELPARAEWVSWYNVDAVRAIPLRVVPAGFAFNTLLFAALAAMMWHAPGAIRRIRRMRGNRCLKCGYARTGLAPGAVCPECGAPGSA